MAVDISNGFLNTHFVREVYQPSIDKCRTINIADVAIALERGTAVIDNDQQCDQYIALYGGLHFHKLYAAFGATNFPYLNRKNVEIIDWGCGQALATCVLIEYLAKMGIMPDISAITLVEPSASAMKRGHRFIRRLLQLNHYAEIPIRAVQSRINDLQSRDLNSCKETIKVHLLSNILDIDTFHLPSFYNLLISSFRGVNRFICISPYNRKNRLDFFYEMFSETRNFFGCEEDLYKEIFFFQTGTYKKHKISRYERQFTANLG